MSKESMCEKIIVVVVEIVRGNGENEVLQRTDDIERNDLLVLHPGVKEGMVVVIPTWKVGEVAMGSRHKKRMQKMVYGGGN